MGKAENAVFPGGLGLLDFDGIIVNYRNFMPFIKKMG